MLSGVGIQELLNLRHAGVGFCAESELDFNEGFEARVQIWDAEVDELGQFGKELFVELFVSLFGHVGFSLCAGQFCNVLIRLFDQFLHLGAHGVIVKEFVVTFLDALVDVGEIGAEARDRFENGCADEQIWLVTLVFAAEDFRLQKRIYRYGPSRALMVSASKSSTACL